jgi:predicted DNA-binding protein (MmcQ/YjbR family)
MKPKTNGAAKAKPAAKPKTAAAAGKAAGTSGSTNHLERLRAICLAYPESTEVVAWGHPTFRVRDKIFASTGDGTTLGVKATHEQQADLVSSDPRFQIADYVGKHGWVTMSLAGKVDFSFVEALIAESYRLVAPKTLANALASAPKGKSSKKTAAKATRSTPKATTKKASVKAPQRPPQAATAKSPARGKLVKASPAKQR